MIIFIRCKFQMNIVYRRSLGPSQLQAQAPMGPEMKSQQTNNIHLHK